MFKSKNFCHVASNNRNTVKVGVFVYRTTDDLDTVTASGYFNERIIDINLHDLIIHEQIDAADNTKVVRNVLCVSERTLDNVNTIVVKSKWEGDIEQEIEDLRTYVDNTFVKKDGSSVMTGPLKFRAGSFVGAIAGGLGDGISFYKLKSDNTIDSEVASLTLTNGFLPGTNNTMNIGSNSLKWKDAYISRVITSVLNNGADINIPTTAGTIALTSDIAIKSTEANIVNPTAGQWLQYNGTKWENVSLTPANTDLSNLSSTGANIGNWSSNVTNCITEIPQDIKLELNNGTLTLKAGSKVYVPNGSGTFDTVTTTADVSTTRTDTNKCMVWRYSGGNLGIFPISLFYSGPTAPTAYTYMFWYDTTENKCKHTSDGGSTWTSGDSLPLCLVSTDGTKISAIDQVFNGFGYVGSTVFVLPNVKGLIPNGRNIDGTLKTTSITTSTVITRTGMGINVSNYYAGLNAGYFINYSTNYTFGDDGFLRIPNGTIYQDVVFVIYSTGADGRITSFTTKPVFHAVDYYDFWDLANNVVKLSGNQTIAGTKTFSSSPIAPTPTTSDNSTKVATSAFVKSYAMGLPDWANATSITNNTAYTATANGFVVASGYTTADALTNILTINGSTVLQNRDNHYGGSGQMCVPISVGDVYKVYFDSDFIGVFVPFKNA